jgi:hypothetical protein
MMFASDAWPWSALGVPQMPPAAIPAIAVPWSCGTFAGASPIW